MPYAQSLKPGAKIISSGYPAIHAESTHPSGRGIRGYATADSGTNFGVVGASKSPNGYGGYFYNNEGGYGVYGTGKYGGYFTTNQGGTHDNRNAGVNVTTAYEYSDGVRAYTTGDYSRGVCVDSTGVGRDGVRAHTTGDCSHGVRAYTTGDNSYGVCAHTTGVGSVGVRVATTGDYSSGVTALTSGTNSSGVYARSTNYHGVYGITDSADSAGVYARGIDSGADLILGGNGDKGVKDDGRIYSDPEYTSSDIFLISNDGIRINLDNDGDGEDADFEIYDKDDNLIFNVDESGDMYASGTKSAVVATKDYGTRKMYALESTEVWFEDFGMTQLEDGVAVVEIDPVFAETVNMSVDYHVFFTPVDGWAPLYVANKTSMSFELRDANDKANITLEYRIVARRLGYKDVRMEQVEPRNEEA